MFQTISKFIHIIHAEAMVAAVFPKKAINIYIINLQHLKHILTAKDHTAAPYHFT